MTSLLDDVAELVFDAVSEDLFYDAKLSRAGQPTGPIYDPTPGAPESWSCKALVDEWSSSLKANGLIASSDRKIMVLAFNLGTTPQDGDIITVKGKSYRISAEGGTMPAVTTDPAEAVWNCRGKS